MLLFGCTESVPDPGVSMRGDVTPVPNSTWSTVPSVFTKLVAVIEFVVELPTFVTV